MTVNFLRGFIRALRKTGQGLLLCVGLLTTPFYTQASNDEEKVFLQAIDAIKAGQRHALAEHKKTLQNHPLIAYVLYQDYIRNFERTPEAAIHQFIERYPYTAAAQRLQERYLTQLANKSQWKDLLQQAQTYSAQTNLTCQLQRARLETDQSHIDIAQLQALWLNLPSNDQACRSIEHYLTKQQHLTPDLVWQKIDAAMLRNDLKQARALQKHLPKQEQTWLNLWIDIHQHPNKLATQTFDESNPILSRKIIVHGLKRLAQRDLDEAQKQLEELQQRYALNEADRLEVQRHIGLRLAYRYDDKAHAHLAQVNALSADEDTLRWQAQIALRQSDWKGLLHTISLMPAADREQPKWLYWTARALDMTQQRAQAEPIFLQLAQGRHYYGFLSADYLNLPYQFRASQVHQAVEREKLLQTYPAIALIEALFAVNWTISANREWQHLIQTAAPEDLAGLAAIANEWQQHNIAIRTLAQGQLWDILELRFPTPYKEPVMQSAEKNRINPSWIYGVMRRESAFSPDVRSPAGAVGLMQILPNTARYVGQKIGYNSRQYTNLTDARSNIELGSAYLRYLLERYDGNLILATAAYNAGPRRVDSWIMNDVIAADQWVDSIPFKETRKYVKSVLEYTMVFQNLLDNRYDRLTPLMLPIGQYTATKQLDLP